MIFDGLWNVFFDRVELYGIFDFEIVFIGLVGIGIRRDIDKNKLFFVVWYFIVDDLVCSEVGVLVKYLLLVSV